ncbi:hypothetical protein H0H81_000078 [Sphagnurus paluster]|uniref:DUF5648 domain-containing protein n=1 Tax=Sphagnurus paluster TaxID=117069 RepID=A0A9P7KLC9_9AGAR|nr:hypothetical protein H0H81_000078 [Sphagnurus paluster]
MKVFLTVILGIGQLLFSIAASSIQVSFHDTQVFLPQFTRFQTRAPAGTTRIWAAMSTDLVDHVYSTNATELQYLIDFYGFSIEGPKGTGTGYIYTTQQPNTVPVYRLYGIGRTDHFLTTSVQERDLAVKRWGYHVEGILGYIQETPSTGLVPFHRLYNAPIHDHYYTTTEKEREDASRNGWTEEGVLGYIFPLEDDAPALDTTSV